MRKESDKEDNKEVAVIVHRNEVRMREPFNVPPQPLWFPPTTSMKPEPCQGKEAVRFNDVVRKGAEIGFLTGVIGSTNLVSFTPFTHHQISSYIMNPKIIPIEHQHVVQKDGDKIFPFNLPDISDLSLHPKVYRIVMEWLVKKGMEDNVERVVTMLLRETATELLTRRETYTMGRGTVSEVTIRSCGNYFKAIDVNVMDTSSVVLNAAFESTTEDGRDGRTINLSMSTVSRGVVNLKKRRLVEPKMVGMLVWNCRGLAAWGFPSAMESLMRCHMPTYVVLMETRVPETLLVTTLRRFGFRQYVYAKPVGGAGGLAIMSVLAKDTLMLKQNNLEQFHCVVELV